MMVYVFGLLFVFIAIGIIYVGRILLFKVRKQPADAEAPTLDDTADKVFQYMSYAVPDSRTSDLQAVGGLVWSVEPPPARARSRPSVSRGVVRAHPEAGSDPELPKYSAAPTASQVCLELDPPPVAHVRSEETEIYSIARDRQGSTASQASSSTNATTSDGPVSPHSSAPSLSFSNSSTSSLPSLFSVPPDSPYTPIVAPYPSLSDSPYAHPYAATLPPLPPYDGPAPPPQKESRRASFLKMMRPSPPPSNSLVSPV